MDDKEPQPAQQDAQEMREKGADLEYDAEDEDALAQSAPAFGPAQSLATGEKVT